MNAETIRLISQLENTRLLLEALSLESEQKLTYNLRSDINKHADDIKESHKEVRRSIETKDLSVGIFALLGFAFIVISILMILQGVDWENVFILVVGIFLMILSRFAFKTRVSDDKRQRIKDSITYLVRDLRTYGSLRSISDQQAIETIDEINTLIDNLKETFG